MGPGHSDAWRDRVALITGGSSGIGLAVARQFVAGGGRVALVARGEERLRAAADELGPGRALPFPLDVSDLAALQLLPRRVHGALGRLDLIVNNAGVNHRGPFVQQSPEQLEAVVRVNLVAPMILARAAAPLLGPGSAIVNVASLAGMVPVHHEAAYSASKAGLRAFTRVLADELGAAGVHVATVCPGPVDTGFFGELDKVPELVFSQPMSSAQEVAAAILRCASGGREEIALPWLSGKFATLGYLSPWLLRTLRPLLLRRGARSKARYVARAQAGLPLLEAPPGQDAVPPDPR